MTTQERSEGAGRHVPGGLRRVIPEAPAAVVLALFLATSTSCAFRHAPEVGTAPKTGTPAGQAAEPREEAPPFRPMAPPPPPEKTWAHTFVRNYTPPWRAEPANGTQTVVVPLLAGEQPPSVLEVALRCSIVSWNASGTMRFKVEVSGFPQTEGEQSAGGYATLTVKPKRHSLTSEVLLSAEVPLPQGVNPIAVRVTRDFGQDTFNQHPLVSALRVSY